MWHFAHGLSYVACGNFKFLHAQQCSSGPQQMFAALKGYAIVNHGKRCPEMAIFPKLILHRSLSRGEEASKGKSTDLRKSLGQGPISLIAACINEVVSGPSASQPPSATRVFTVPGGKPTTAAHAYSAPPEKLAWGPGRHVCWSVVERDTHPFDPVISTCLSQSNPPLFRFFTCKKH